MTSTKSESEKKNQLTRTEAAVLHLIRKGKTAKGAARVLLCSHNTVKTHMAKIREKLLAVNMTDAVVKALEQGILDLNEVKK